MGRIAVRQLDNGAVVVVESIPNVASAALRWLLPAGSAADPPGGDGQAALLSEILFRGAGGLSSREHSDALDRLGVQRGGHVTSHHLHLSGALLGERLEEALPLLTAMLVDPALPGEAMGAVRSLCLQALDALPDDPQHLVMLRLRERHLPPPLNRHGYGEREVLERCSIETIHEAWEQRCRPGGAILAAAGAVDPDSHVAQLRELLAEWRGEAPAVLALGPPQRGHTHLEQSTAQMHLGIAYDGPREADPDSVLERVAIAILSGGTSARLFTEVRQKRSLCYSVGASFRAGRDRGVVTVYAGTTPQRAQETLDVCAAEIDRLRRGVSDEEVARAVIGLRSRLVMSGESTSARAAAISQDMFRLGRPRTLAERAAQFESVTAERLCAYLRGRDFGEMTVVSIGPLRPRVAAIPSPPAPAAAPAPAVRGTAPGDAMRRTR
jgi:predicted Zn-dependent peptidase